MRIPSARFGKSWWLMALAMTFRDEPNYPICPPLRLGPAKPRKHWVRDKDWTQRQPNRRRRNKR